MRRLHEGAARAKFCGADVLDSRSPAVCGEMAEWLKAHAWKACIPQGIQGSNPCLSAITLDIFLWVDRAAYPREFNICRTCAGDCK